MTSLRSQLALGRTRHAHDDVKGLGEVQSPMRPSAPVSVREGGYPSLPDRCRIYAVGDVHGRSDLLLQTVSKIENDLARYRCQNHINVFIGDYLDRGPDSHIVIALLMKLSRLRPTVCLAGNHELFALGALSNPRTIQGWLGAGGRETLHSYGVKLPRQPGRLNVHEIAEAFARALGAHRRFLESLAPTFSLGEYFFAHAGVRPGVPLALQATEDLVMIREPFLSFAGDFGKIIVHGHTPVREPDLRSNRINIDTGAYATSRLTCVVIERGVMRIL
jgi:serine/threonine protein phosphatase 1